MHLYELQYNGSTRNRHNHTVMDVYVQENEP